MKGEAERRGLPAMWGALRHPGEQRSGMVGSGMVGKKGWEGERWGFVFPRESLPYPPQSRERCGERACAPRFLDEAAPALGRAGRGRQGRPAAAGCRWARGAGDDGGKRSPSPAPREEPPRAWQGGGSGRRALGAAERAEPSSRRGHCRGERSGRRAHGPAPAGGCSRASCGLLLFSLLGNPESLIKVCIAVWI